MTQIWLNTMILSYITYSPIRRLCIVCFATGLGNQILTAPSNSLLESTHPNENKSLSKSTRIIQDNSYKYM